MEGYFPRGSVAPRISSLQDEQTVQKSGSSFNTLQGSRFLGVVLANDRHSCYDTMVLSILMDDLPRPTRDMRAWDHQCL